MMLCFINCYNLLLSFIVSTVLVYFAFLFVCFLVMTTIVRWPRLTESVIMIFIRPQRRNSIQNKIELRTIELSLTQ